MIWMWNMANEVNIEELLQQMRLSKDSCLANIPGQKKQKKAEKKHEDLVNEKLELGVNKVSKPSTANIESARLLRKLAKDIRNGATDFCMTIILNGDPYHISDHGNIHKIKEEALQNLRSATAKIELY